MPTPANARLKRLHDYSHLLWEYSYFLRQELRNPVIYLTSIAIGIAVIWLLNAPSMVPFVTPFAVQLAVNAILRFKNRDIETLLLLPGQRKDPAFIMDHTGSIVMATGRTERLFRQKNIVKITDMIGTDDFHRLIKKLDLMLISSKALGGSRHCTTSAR